MTFHPDPSDRLKTLVAESFLSVCDEPICVISILSPNDGNSVREQGNSKSQSAMTSLDIADTGP